MKKVKKTALGAGTALAVYLVLLAVVSALMARGTVEEARLRLCVWIFACAASFAGAKLGSAGESDPLAAIALCAAMFWALALLAGFLACDALEPSRSVTLALPILTGAALAYLAKPAKKKRHAEKGRRRGHK